MNILYITNHLNVGGITSYVLSLATGMKERGHQVYIASSGGKLLSRFLEGSINYIPLSIKTKKELSPKILVSAFKLTKVVKECNINLVHSHSRTTQVLGSLLSRFVGIPHISTCHGFFKKRPLRRLFPCWGIRVIAISESIKEHLMKDFGVKEKDIAFIHNGIDVKKSKIKKSLPAGRQEKSKIDIKKELGLNEGSVIGIVARLSDVKGHLYLIEAMRSVIEKIPSAQLLIVGEGREKEALVRQVADLGITQNVFFIPSVYDTQEVLSAMDLFVLPSLKEGLGLALMEAMASGLAVIGTDVGGIRNLIQGGFNGLLVKPADSNGLSLAILELLQDQQKRESLGKAAQIFINQNFSAGKMVLETERVYLECLDAGY